MTCCVVAGLAISGGAWLLMSNSPVAGREPDEARLVQTILQSLETRSGLCVHLGVQDGTLAVQLSRDGKNLVHGLATGEEAVGRARETIAAARLDGVVSVEYGSVRRLPYADDLVNLLVVDDLLGLLQQGLELDEVLRVLHPGGIAWLGQRAGTDGPAPTAEALKDIMTRAGVKEFEVLELEGVWARIVDPRPASMDQWTHKRYDASANPVSSDREVGVPSGVRWAAGPNWPTGNRKSAVHGVVASRKHLVYVFEDEVPTPTGLARQNSLIARDSYNGLRLWKRKAESTALVAVGNRVYTVVEGGLVALDADTGEIVRRYEGADGSGQVLYLDGRLIADASDGLSCLDAQTGELQWRHSAAAKRFLTGDGCVFLHTDDTRRGEDSVFACLDLDTGKLRWQQSTASWAQGAPDLILHKAGILVAASRGGTHAVSAADGSHLWTYGYPLIGHGGSFSKVMHLDGLVWVHNAQPAEGSGYAWEGLDPATGEVTRRIFHTITTKHRCYTDVATERYFLCGTMDFVDLASREQQHFSAAKSSCRAAGVVPANGLVYTFPHACGCYSMLRGFLGLATAELPTVPSVEAAAERLHTGPAFGDEPLDSASSEDDWPTYRHDPRRSGSTTAPGPAGLDRLWEADVASPDAGSLADEWELKDGGRLSSPVIAEGLAFVAAVDGQRVRAFDAASGTPRWSYAAGGRVDCPPTVHRGLCLFGSRDGWVYCLRAADGALVWRFRAAPDERRILAYGQLESSWPVYGGVLVFDSLAYFLAGRHPGSDGGLFVYSVEPDTGKLVWVAQPAGHTDVPDVLTGQDGSIQMGSWQADAKTGASVESARKGLRGGRLGLLNDGWYKRPIALRKNLQLWSAGEGRSGQMLAFNPSVTCGFRAPKVNGGDGTLSGDATLFADVRNAPDRKGWSIAMATPSRLKGMVLTRERLYVAGRFDDGETASNVVRAYSAADGSLLGEHAVGEVLVHDCLAVAADKLYLTTQSGKLICLGAK
jgi:outer membrane protein assembly factor BamB